nr:NAD(P)-binding domain-containing protein [Chitinophaga vietnamensis]
MKIGVIGAGAIGMAFARKAAAAGYEVLISNSRGPASLAAAIGDTPGLAATTNEAVAAADIILLSVPWQHLDAATQSLPDLSGKVVLDATNPVILPGFILPDLGGKASSEIVSGKVKGAAVVKAFNTLSPKLLAAPSSQFGGRRVIFYAGDDAAAKARVAALLEQMGFAGIDLGGLLQGAAMQQFPGGPLAGLHLELFPFEN